MYYETRFTGELLATLLNIPPSKTLLRRHLNTRFNQLLGKEIIQEKREAEQTLGYQPLTLTSKVKVNCYLCDHRKMCFFFTFIFIQIDLFLCGLYSCILC